MPPSSGELWGHHLMPAQIDVDCLLPTGIIVPITCNRDSNLEKIKAELWREMKRYPLHDLLSDMTSYIFVSITQDAEKEEFYDETRRLCDLRLFQPILKVVEPKGNRDEKMLNYDIGLAVGVSVNELNEMKNLEVMTFRRRILSVCQEAVTEREEHGHSSLALYTYPPEIESGIPSHILDKLNKDQDRIIICIWVVSADNSRTKYTVQVHHTSTPENVIAEAIRRKTRSMKMTSQEQQQCIDEYSDMYLLKVCGCDQFMLGAYPMSQYKYIRHCLVNEHIPQLLLMTKQSVFACIPRKPFILPSYVEKGKYALADINKQHTKSLWDLDTRLRIKINCATYVSVQGLGKIYIKSGIYHGTESLCPNRETVRVECDNPRWTEWIDYDLEIPDVPRCASLCLSICSVAKKKSKEQHYALAWGNLQLFDFNNRLLCDKLSLHLWPMPPGMDDLLNPIGMPGSNPDQDCPCLEIEFDRYSYPVTYPSSDQIDEMSRWAHSREETDNLGVVVTSDGPVYQQIEHKMITIDHEIVAKIIQQDPLAEISEQDKERLWKYRHYCLTRPNSLPKLLSAVRWNSREDVAQMYTLLKRWPTVSLETAFELLDCSFPDLMVRTFAIRSLSVHLTDDLLSLYLIQLVQVLKFEPYLDNALTRFLVKRALLNVKIGQFFFWHLKSEMHQANIRLRFSLILEAYCRGCGAYLKALIRQVEALDKLTKLTDTLKTEVKDDDQLSFLATHFQQPDYTEALQGFTSPLNNSHTLGELVIQKCKVMSSKKRPLWIEWTNPDPMAEFWVPDYKLMFKNGDDLRQDMLTLQVLRIMDGIWQNEGLDLRMLPYGCLSTGKSVGLIEVVRRAKTVMAIQNRALSGAMQMDTSQLHMWIKENNKHRYQQAIETFTKSCAGYCVATFVLGIGDRHSENIMVTEEGQVFHIDFGHFLNHKKKKFGINRERVPFVLTDDFLRVIALGVDNPTKSEHFENFQTLCEKAYISLRKHANLFISLFTMMLSCGIPELQSLDDISYLRKTLAVEKDEVEALRYFSQQLQEAYRGAWSTKLNFLFHGIGQSLK